MQDVFLLILRNILEQLLMRDVPVAAAAICSCSLLDDDRLYAFS